MREAWLARPVDAAVNESSRASRRGRAYLLDWHLPLNILAPKAVARRGWLHSIAQTVCGLRSGMLVTNGGERFRYRAQHCIQVWPWLKNDRLSILLPACYC